MPLKIILIIILLKGSGGWCGFIGLEMAENLHHIGASVSIVEKLNQVMPPIDFSMAAMVEEHLC